MAAHTTKTNTGRAHRLCFMGNCQAMFLQELDVFKNYPTKLFRLACPVLADKGTFAEVKEKTIANFFSSDSMTFMQRSNDFSIQPSIKEIKRFAPTHIILTVFDPLLCYVHKTDGYIISLRDPKGASSFHQWVFENFTRMNCNIANYFDQFSGMVRTLKRHFPHCNITVVTRMRHFNFDRSKIFEAFNGWEDIAHLQEDWAKKLAAQDRVTVIDLERVVAGVAGTESFEAAFPYMEAVSRSNIAHTEISFMRDLEHFGHKVALRVSDCILKAAEGKSFRYSADELVPARWQACHLKYTDFFKTQSHGRDPDDIEADFSSASWVRQTLAIYSLLGLPKEEAVSILLKNAPKISLWCNTVRALHTFCTVFFDERLIDVLNPILKNLKRMSTNNDFHIHHHEQISQAIAWQQHKVPQRRFLSDAPLDQKDAYIWGTGTKGKLLLKQMRLFGDHARVKGYISSAAASVTPFHGLHLYPPSAILDTDSIIIIASAFEGQIRASFNQADCRATIYSCDDVFYFYNMLTGNWYFDA